MTPTISVTDLSRRYRDQAALAGVSLTVEPGTVTGLLGRNGAGKTTLLRIITGLEFPTAGEVKVFGAAPAENDAVDWKRGSYVTVPRRGRIESSARWGEPKPPTTMIAEGSVLLAANELQGAASNVAPVGFPHPVYRSGFAVTVSIPWRVAA